MGGTVERLALDTYVYDALQKKVYQTPNQVYSQISTIFPELTVRNVGQCLDQLVGKGLAISRQQTWSTQLELEYAQFHDTAVHVDTMNRVLRDVSPESRRAS